MTGLLQILKFASQSRVAHAIFLGFTKGDLQEYNDMYEKQ